MKLEKVAGKLGGKLLGYTQLSGGISVRMFSVNVRTGNTNQRFVVRLPRDRLFNGLSAAAYEYRVLEMLQSQGVSAPKPILLDETRQLCEAPYLVTNYIEGGPVYHKDVNQETLDQMAETLSTIHSIDTGKAGFLRRLNIKGIESKNKPALLHGDFWPGNILWCKGTLAAVVDWEDAIIGDPLYDFSIARHDVLMIYGKDAMEFFTEKYRESSPIDFSTLPYWDLQAANRIEAMIPEIAEGWTGLGRPDLTEEKIRDSLNYFIRQAKKALS